MESPRQLPGRCLARLWTPVRGLTIPTLLRVSDLAEGLAFPSLAMAPQPTGEELTP